MNVETIRNDFPIYKNKSISDFIYLDSASTSLKHHSVIDELNDYHNLYSANVHRSVYPIAEKATNKYEATRKKIADFINSNYDEIIFTKNTTESINLVAYSWAMDNIKENDTILITEMEHHSNIIPWQNISHKTGCRIDYIKVNKSGILDLDDFDKKITQNVKFVSVIHQSNVTGVINDIKYIIDKSHANQALVLVDSAQSISHEKIDVKTLNCDFLVFSGHKMFASTGVGILYGKKNILENMQPFMFGGQMINIVERFSSSYNDVPYKFEAGTPNIAEVISLSSSIDYINKLGFKNIQSHLKNITNRYLDLLNDLDNTVIYGKQKNRGPVISFNIDKIHAYDFCQIMGQHNISMRAGNHCAQPLLEVFNTSSAIRISFQVYNTLDEASIFEEKLKQTVKMLS